MGRGFRRGVAGERGGGARWDGEGAFGSGDFWGEFSAYVLLGFMLSSGVCRSAGETRRC